MSSSPSGTLPVTSKVSKPASFNPEVNQTTCFAGPPTFSRAMILMTLELRIANCELRISFCEEPLCILSTSISQFAIRISLSHAKRCFAVVLVTNLVDFLFPSSSAIKPVGTVDHDAFNVSDILIRMHNSGRYQHRRRIVLAHN